MEEHLFNVVDGNVQNVHLGYAGDSIDRVVKIVAEGTLNTTRDSWSTRARTGQHVRNVPKNMRYSIYKLTILASVDTTSKDVVRLNS